MLYELAANPSIQTRLRQEMHETERKIRARGSTEFSLADIEAMQFTQAVVKETLRLHPVAPHMFRVAMKDDVLPLAKPVRTKSGELLSTLPIAKGTRIVTSIATFHRFVSLAPSEYLFDLSFFCYGHSDPELWGSNPHVFDPDRWLDGRVQKSVAIGAYSNL